MNKFTKRILLANDVILAIRSQHIIPFGNRLFSRPTENKLTKAISPTCSLQQVVNKTNECQACANGALLLAYIGRFNSVDSISDIGFSNVQTDTPLSKLFKHKELDEIEYLFEGDTFPWHVGFSGEDMKKMDNFRDSIQQKFNESNPLSSGSLRSRIGMATILIATMQKLIDNNGKKIIL